MEDAGTARERCAGDEFVKDLGIDERTAGGVFREENAHAESANDPGRALSIAGKGGVKTG